MVRFLIHIAFLFTGFIFSTQISGQSFQDVAQQQNVSYPYPIHAGVSFADFDGDGLDDITLGTPNTDSLLIYRNTGNGFVKVPDPVGHTNYSTTVTWVDYDNDGDKDLYVTSMYIANKLYRNDSTAGFTDVTFSSGIYSPITPSFGCSWGDYNNDGWLDMHQCNRTAGSPNYLYLSNGSGGFTETAVTAGVGSDMRLSFSSAFIDINNNGLQDLFIANDRMQQSMLYKNQGDSTFQDISLLSGAGIVIEGMSTTIGDYDNDGYLDIYVTNTYEGNKLFRNNHNETFTELSDTIGVAFNSFCWGSYFLDYDNDGDLDLYVSDLYNDTIPGSGNGLLQNDGNSFSQPANQLPGDTLQSYACAIGDFNNDGYYDIVSPNYWPQGLQLWENLEAGGNWVKVLLEGTHSNRDGIGSWIRVYSGQDTISRYTRCGDAYLSQESFTKIIGLGNDSIIDSLKIRWLSGHVDAFYNLPANQLYKVKEGSTYSTALNISGKLQFCKGDSINIVLNPNKSHSHYQWSTGDTSQTITISQPGSYHLKVTSNAGFVAFSDTLLVKIDSLHLQTSVVHDSLNLGQGVARVQVTGGFPPYQYLWDDPLQQNGPEARNLVQGVYQVNVIDSLGCIDSATAEVENPLSHSGIPVGIQMFPNPLYRGENLILIPGFYGGRLSLRITDMMGKTLAEETIYSGVREMKIKTSALKPGTYLLILSSETESLKKKLTIQ